MKEPENALVEWWKLVKPGGYLILIVPDEDLYEQGVFPSRFNPDNKATFTISKAKGWSPVSINVLDLVKRLPNSEIISLELQDNNYDRSLLNHGNIKLIGKVFIFFCVIYRRLKKMGFLKIPVMEDLSYKYFLSHQTFRPDVLAQIQCILKKSK